MNGAELIAQERSEQILKHKRTIESDKEDNDNFQLIGVAGLLMLPDEHRNGTELDDAITHSSWSTGTLIKMFGKSYKERLIIAGALIAAEIDRIS